ncbi:hypothetical protein M501DRAFT_998054 [Patellaria atrata CBS 101060]|uniref:Uncharacterized protein n=1 Tax=Patellaria atrata CBS 101060 TaxID=1346257 RepID=A0A9P4VUD3_9PEZI|nr:hypothetical protein M501DRAFT_998054 [Patellaria atrata CBS 101060]
MECDAPGVCVKEEYCGGFAGLRCETTGMRCIDDPRDNCDPKKGGADFRVVSRYTLGQSPQLKAIYIPWRGIG